jgi:hypothetical protein
LRLVIISIVLNIVKGLLDGKTFRQDLVLEISSAIRKEHFHKWRCSEVTIEIVSACARISTIRGVQQEKAIRVGRTHRAIGKSVVNELAISQQALR